MRSVLLSVLVLVSLVPARAQENTSSQGNREPSGLRVRWYSLMDREPDVPRSTALVEWGASAESVNELLDESCQVKLDDEEMCFLGLGRYDGWYADFGDDRLTAYEPRLLFFNNELYSYHVSFPAEYFSFVDATLRKAVGKPSNQESSSVHNRMGAEFDQEILIWELKTTQLILMKRAATVDKGVLSVTYRPIASKIPKEEKAGEAPFN